MPVAAQLAEESRAADKRLEERIAALVSSLGDFISKSAK